MFRISRRLDRLLAATLIALSVPATARDSLPELGLMGSIPIYWGEAEGVSDVLGADFAPHWARAQLERDFHLRPLDTLSESGLADLEFLLLAQPRALSPAENIALDAWVRAGGRVLLFADPMLTGHSRFGIGDRRRPQDVILLSPILDHWGLRLEFDIAREPGVALLVAGTGAEIPVDLPGQFAGLARDSDCALDAQAILASCEIGTGRAVVLADAALLDLHDPHPAATAALASLLDRAFVIRGTTREEPQEVE